MKISLSGNHWSLKGYWPHTPLFGRSMETGVAMGGVTKWMQATVPGCVHADLLANGAIEDPYWEMNSLQCEWVENRWWVYRTEFTADAGLQGQNAELVFLGVDYKCHVFLNNEKLCEHEGMFEPIRLDVTDRLRFGCANALEVVLESAPDEMGQIGHTSRVRTQKSRFGYKWDFATRLVHTGIWDDVFLHVFPGARFNNPRVAAALEGAAGIVDVEAPVALAPCGGYAVTASLTLDGAEVARETVRLADDAENAVARIRLRVDEPRLWWPNGHGAQPLYGVELMLMRGEERCDEYRCRTGIRSLAYEAPEGAVDSLPYGVVVNGKRIYIKGVNMTPLDHMIGAVTRERYAETLALARDANVNLIRVWGGGIIEKEPFYDLCDAYGILVWQEFNQSSSGIDNVPPKDGAFLGLLAKNAAAGILARRNHVSLAFWSGGNELMDWDGVPVTYGDENIAMLRGLVEELDPGRLFLPTSASGPSEFLNVSEEGRGRNHDVHGPWQYQGAEGHYELYNRSDSLLHSEFGVDGFTNLQSIPKFLGGENLVPSSVNDNPVWRHHGEWWDTGARDRELFGEPADLEEMALRSQYIQAEGLRYAVEANRRRAFRNCGSIIWQFNEPWPNLFCTSLVDYYKQPKPAYTAVKRAYAPLAVSLMYDRLRYAVGELFLGSVWIADDACAFAGAVLYRVLDVGGRVLAEGRLRASCGGRHAVCLGSLGYTVRAAERSLFVVELSIEGGGEEYYNRYMFSHGGTPVFAGCPRETLISLLG